ncbi:MAG: hypothetical protein B7Z66_12395 [Chromatiales bacterium 21-64-14]|nr:MAG: hypothetical protein B7Z66_12395 [Chromatiales bacterium 21-64-14]HQU16968.1 RMD1 family protein [Gammaproteobacteria bacterium]
MTQSLFAGKTRLRARALFVGGRIDVRALENAERLANSPLVVRAGAQGAAVLFRYGVLVLFGILPLEEVSFLSALAPLINDRSERPESEEVELVVDPNQDERIDGSGAIVLNAPGIDRLQIVADILAKSVVLAHYEARVAKVFDRIEPLAADLQRSGRTGHQGKELLHQIGDVLLTQQHMVGRVEVVEKPEMLWDHPELERLYNRLRDEYELRERHRALDRKLELISRTAETVLELVQTRRSLRVEWYIVVLILVEIVLTLYQMFFRH